MTNFVNGQAISNKPLVVASLPTAAAQYLGLMVRIVGGGGTESTTYRCELAEDGNHHWVPISYGGLEG